MFSNPLRQEDIAADASFQYGSSYQIGCATSK